MARPILISLSPNTDKTDVWLAVKLLFQPQIWQTGESFNQLEELIKKYFSFKHVYLVNSCRTALYLGLKSLNLIQAEVLYPAFTCQVVPQAIIKAGLTPVGYQLNQIEAKINNKTKVLIIQHLFGIPDEMTKIKVICKKYKLILIEDLAHGLGGSFKGKKLGSFGDLTVLSFGRDKVISSIFGGALLSRKPINLNLPFPDKIWILKQLLHPLIFSVAVPTYFYLGKYLIHLCRKLNLITLPLANLPVQFLPNALAVLVLNQWSKLNWLNQHRRQIAKIYCEAFGQQFNPEAVYLRFPLAVKNPVQLIKLGKQKQIWLGNWYDNKIVNLPTHPRMKLTDAVRVVNLVKAYAQF